MRSTSEEVAEFSDAWILRLRPAKNRVDPRRPYHHLAERERTAAGRVEAVATIFLTNRECPFRCLMCDLWKNTTEDRVEVGAIPTQIRWALDRLPAARHIKLYNSGSFFDSQAIPPEDDAEIARIVRGFETVIVESHPRLVGRRCLAFQDRVAGKVQVAMGLETVHPEVLPKLNKRMTLGDFERAVRLLRQNAMQARAFILLRPPFLSEAEGVLWAKRSVDFAFDTGVECCCLIPTRAGNGAMETLARRGDFEPPTLDSLEEVLAYGIAKKQGRVFADLWDLSRQAHDVPHRQARLERLERMNLSQRYEPRIDGESAKEHATRKV